MFEFNKCVKTMSSYFDYIYQHFDEIDLLNDKMTELYFYLKEISPKFAKKGIITDEFKAIIKYLYKVEKRLPAHFILENNPKYDFDYKVNRNQIINCSEDEIIKYIIHEARSILVDCHSSSMKKDLGQYDLMGDCSNTSFYVNYICGTMKIPCKIYVIHPAFFSRFNLYGRGGKHQFCLVRIGQKKYIVDVTYSQFFTMRANNLNRIGVPLLAGCNVGIYMTLDDERKNFAEKLMRDGYVEATDENIKLFFDGFSLSYRNGIYYENKGIVTYTTEYTANDYIDFLEERDSQLNHENVEELGRQKRILKDLYLNFDIRK